MKKFSIAIHGGAGTIRKSSMTPEKEKAYTDALNESLREGIKILEKGGTATDAVTQAVISMENSPLFNAGYGSVYTHNREHELDASIMEGKNRKAGAVAGVQKVKNPIELCRKIMQSSEHVFMIGKGAEEFAEQNGFEMVDQKYFGTQFRLDQLLKIINSDKTQLDHTEEELKKFGTVGAVALDEHGNLASATSTGGLTNKRFGRVGDTSIIGAGTYAENGVCAVSSTGWGEFFIRSVAAYEVAALIKYANLNLSQASEKVIREIIPEMGGDGGLIAIDSNGEIAMPFNTEGMYRGAANSDGLFEIGIYT
jgi:beta-aspartyl-peptidase (threonine type)